MLSLAKQLTRWSWLKLTGEDPVVVSGYFHSLSSLNSCHCEFLDRLDKDHPELKLVIEEHQRNRAMALDSGTRTSINTRMKQ